MNESSPHSWDKTKGELLKNSRDTVGLGWGRPLLAGGVSGLSFFRSELVLCLLCYGEAKDAPITHLTSA